MQQRRVNGDISAPTAGATLGSWTGAGGAITAGNMSEYDLNANGTTGVQFTSSPTTWAAMAMAFYTSSVSTQPVHRDDQYVSFLDSRPWSQRELPWASRRREVRRSKTPRELAKCASECSLTKSSPQPQ